MNDKLVQEAIERFGSIAGQVLEDGLSFGPRTITDPETGGAINVEGYNAAANQSLLLYMDTVGDTLGKYYECVKDIFFFEMVLSPENFPEFSIPEHVSRYLKINYQSWIIRVNTLCDCTAQALNAAFELNHPPKKINKNIIISDLVIRNHPGIFNHFEKLNSLLKAAIKNSKNHVTQRSIEDIRHKIIHYNEFDHSGLSDLDFDTVLLNFDMLDMDAFQFQANVGSTSFELNSAVRETSMKIIREVYPIFEHIGVEYRRRFKGKLIE